jgi:FkbM family methyltransferase
MLSVTEADILPHIRQMVSDSGAHIEYITVKSKTFSEIMLMHPNITHIDFLSIDVEGGEINVLKSIDFDK